MLPSAWIGNLCAVREGIVHQGLQVVCFPVLRKRSDFYPRIPRSTPLKLFDSFHELGYKGIVQASVHPLNFECRTPLAVEAECSRKCLIHRQVEVGIGEGDSRIFGIEAQHGAQAVAMRVQPLEVVGTLVGSDKREHRNLS